MQWALVEPSFRAHGITLEVEAKNSIEMNGFANEYSQVLINLLTNAKEAILAHNRDGGSIIVRLKCEEGLSRLTVTDNGGGISDHAMSRLFAPYFSTKEGGTGIGLYMSKMIIENSMKGFIEASNVT